MSTPLKSRQQVLSECLVLAAKQYGSQPDGELTQLIASVVAHIPEEGFGRVEPVNRVLLIGDIDGEVADEFIGEAWNLHYCQPAEIPLEVIMSSSGGDVAAGSMICSVITDLRRQGRTVKIHVAGFAMSTAFDILQCADQRTAEPTASLMVHHERFALEESSATTAKREGEASIARAKLVFAEWSKRTGRQIDYYTKKISGGEWYLSPQEAFAEGLLDAVCDVPPFRPTHAANGHPPRHRKPKALPSLVHPEASP